MPRAKLTAQEQKQITDFLSGYATNKKMLALDRYEQMYFSDDGENDFGMPTEEPLARAKMYGVRHFILGLPNSDEKLFLYYHYVKCQSVARCAELLGVSERSGYRIKARALEIAYGYL